MREPFPKAKSEPPPAFRRALDCPAHDTRCTALLCVLDPLHPLNAGRQLGASGLDTTPAPDARRSHSTPPSGSLLLSHLVDQLSDDPRDQLIKDQRLTIQLYQERLTALQRNAQPSPIPAPPRSRAAVAGKVSLNLGKYTTLAIGVLGLADVVVGLWFPEYVGPLGMVKRVLGVP